MTDLSTLWLFLLRPWRLNSVIYTSVRVQAWLAKIWNSTISYYTWGNSMSKRWKKYVELQIGPRRGKKKRWKSHVKTLEHVPEILIFRRKKQAPIFQDVPRPAALAWGFLSPAS